MNIADAFKRLNAPIANSRASWGSVRESDGSVILRVWQDLKTWHDKRLFLMVTNHEQFVDNETNSGYVERNKHVELVREGRKCLMNYVCRD